MRARCGRLLAGLRLCAGMALLAAAVGCSRGFLEDDPVRLPAAASPLPVPASELRAGFGSSDITPPPGLGLFGYGTEGKRAAGHRFRLRARALVLEDARGERIAIVVADIAVVSSILHRRLADAIVGRTRIGADRLILAGINNHTAPGHFLASGPINLVGSQVPGYDPSVVDFLVQRMSDAVMAAYDRLRRARVSWDTTLVQCTLPRGDPCIRNRALAAFNLNPTPANGGPTPPMGVDVPPTDDATGAVNRTWTMLRVDTLNAAESGYAPAGALSIFGIHGTGNPSAFDLYDSDLSALVQRSLEHYIDGVNGVLEEEPFRYHATHLFANGTLGDVSPSWRADTRCAGPNVMPARRPGGPRTPAGRDDWRDPLAHATSECLARARAFVQEVGTALGDEAVAIFQALDRSGHYHPGDLSASPVTLTRAFETVDLITTGFPVGLCAFPRIGTAAVAGAPDGRSRFYKWKVLGLPWWFNLGVESGGRARDASPTTCQTPKRQLFFPIQGVFLGAHPFPEAAQLSVIRLQSAQPDVPDLVLGIVPFEPTTMAGAMMTAGLRRGLQSATGRDAADEIVAILSIANGYLEYVTTPWEYDEQSYEGGSNLYGEHSAGFFTSRLERLAASLGAGANPSPAARVDPLSAFPGARHAVFPTPRATQPSKRDTLRTHCRVGDSVITIEWRDADPGPELPMDDPLVSLVHWRGGKEFGRAWDDRIDVEVRALRATDDGHVWQVRWLRARPVQHGDRVTFILEPRGSFPRVTRDVECQ